MKPDEAEPGATNRGRPAGITADGAVVGSGAGAGGGGAPEDIDMDTSNGDSGHVVPRPTDRPNTGGDASNHGSR